MPQAKLALSFRIFQNGQLIRQDTLTQGVIKIGKVPSAHLRIDDEAVSRMHAIVEITGHEVSLIDLGSARGTFVNGKKINKARLLSGDVIELGATRIELSIGDAIAAAIAGAAAIDRAAPIAAPAGPPTEAAGEIITRDAAPAARTATPPPLPSPRVPGVVATSAPFAAGDVIAGSARPGPGPSDAGTVAATAPFAAGDVIAGSARPGPAPSDAGTVATSALHTPGDVIAGSARPGPAPSDAGTVAASALHATGDVMIMRSARPTPPPPMLQRAPSLPLDRALDPLLVQRALAESADEPGGARAVEVAAMLGDSVIGVKHCIDPRSGKVTALTWGLFAAGGACLIASAIAFTVSVRNAAEEARRRDAWVRVEHKPERAFRPRALGPGVDWVAFGGLALGLAGLTLAIGRMRGERTSPYYRIGTAPGVELALDGAPLPAFPLVAPSGDDFVFNHGAGIDGELIIDGKATPLAALAAAGRARPSPVTPGALEVPIPAKARIRARVGQTTFVVSAVAPPRRHAAPLFAALERRATAYLAGSLTVHLALWGLLQLIPPDDATVSVEMPVYEDIGIRAAITARADAVPELVEDRGDGAGKEALQPMALPSGATGNPEAAKLDGRLRVARTDDPPRLSREEAIQRAIRDGILGSEQLLTGVKALSAISDLPSGFDTENVNGPIYGLDGEGRGSFGGGVTGIDVGGGCLGIDCYSTYATASRYGTINGGPGAGGDYRLPLGRGRGPRGHLPTPPRIGEPVAIGSGYDKSIIRRYIRRHINEIGYCYEKQLLARPTLGGEIQVSFLISPSGMVQSSVAKGFDPEIASCVAGVIKTIKFPAPGDGGGVQVNYPFRFHGPAS